ncbi:MAG TPA: UDP-N-acetylglucosamine pyrophosphorylase [Planctomycetaceae bacterium]|nr:UDP-N-acetylglucosamine pyrophosphorylase [Planctomycetaceae bacterium]
MTTVPPKQIVQSLADANQSHVLRYWDDLDDAGCKQLIAQLESIDFDLLVKLISGADDKPDFAAMASRALPPPAVRIDGTGAAWSPADARIAGQRALAAGRVGAVIVAGGQGTRLGSDSPKGMFPIGPLSGRTLFEFFADALLALGKEYSVRIPLYLMTSPLTHAETVAYWKENDYLGLAAEDVIIFCQGTMPAIDAATGKLLLASKDSLSLSPDGHGGTVRALQVSGCFDDARKRGVDLLSYIQVDNPLVSLCNVDFIGHHLMSGSEMTTQVVRKRYAEEKVGNVVMVDGTLRIIEYSDLPDEAAQQRDEKGELKLWAGNIAVHMFDIPFLRRASTSVDALPFHRAIKATNAIDQHGDLVKPASPNSIKFERFIFDLLPLAENAFVVEADASDAFAPVKNADGAAHDTPSQSKAAICRLHRKWLRQVGVEIADHVMVEINPRFALGPDQLAKKITPGQVIANDHYFAPGQ